jgi:transcriptional regulator GlxA family with amidase domain
MVYWIFDTLWTAGRFWDPLTRNTQGTPLFEPRVVAVSAGAMQLITGVSIVPQIAIDTIKSTDIIFVPNVVVNTSDEIGALDRRLIDWISRMYQGGVPVYAACGGTLVLAEAGLLDGHEATTFWGYASLFRERFPDVTLHEDRILVQTGRGHSIVCAGGASSWQDLVLMLIAKHAGVAEALRISKLFLYQWHRDGQLPYAAMIRNADHSDAIIARCQEWLADNYARADVVAALLAQSALPKRTFDRRFKTATGYSPLAYVQALRVEEAKQLLETGTVPVDGVGRAVGYQDAASFRRLFRRLAGMPPGDYRRKFQIPKSVKAALAKSCTSNSHKAPAVHERAVSRPQSRG